MSRFCVNGSVLKFLLRLVLVVLLLIAGVYASIPYLVREFGPDVAASFGLEVDSISVSRPGIRSLKIFHAQLHSGGATVSVQDGLVTYALADLWRGRFDTLTFGSAVVTIDQVTDAAADAAGDTASEAVGSPLDVSAMFAAIPLAGIEIGALTLIVPEVGFRGHGAVALRLRHVALERSRAVPGLAELVREPSRPVLGARENDRRDEVVSAQQPVE